MTMKQEKKRIYLRAALALAALLVVLLALDNLSFVPSMLLTVLRKGAIYALVAVSMNLLNGFTGLFSLGQAGFMLLGAYTYAILTIPAASQKSIYQRYANGGIGFSIPELLSKPLGGFGLLLGAINFGNILLLEKAADLGLTDPAVSAPAVRAYRRYRALQHEIRLNAGEGVPVRVPADMIEAEREAVLKLWRTVFETDAPLREGDTSDRSETR